jgi:RHS repeat-associated protein
MLKDDEVSGNSYTTEFRQYDARLGRWTATDPLMNQFPWMSTYCGFDNNPILLKDPKGLSSEEGDKDKKEGDAPKENNEKEYKSKDQIKPIIIRPNEQKEDNERNDSCKGLYGVNLNAFKWKSPSTSLAFKETIYSQSEYTQERWRYYRKQGETLDKVAAGMLLAPVSIITAVETAPVWAPYAWNLAKGYHNTFGMNGGYVNVVTNYLIQSSSTSSMNIGNHNITTYLPSLFVGKFNIETQCYIGAAGGLISYVPNNTSAPKFTHVFNQNIGYTMINVVNGGLAPIYGLGGKTLGYFGGGLQQSIGGYYINKIGDR